MRILVVVAVMAGFTALGLLVRRWRGLGAAEAKRLNTIALNVTLPTGVFVTLHDFAIDARALAGPAIVFVLTLVLWGLGEAGARALRLGRGAREVFILAVMFSNTAFLGFPFNAALLGPEGLAQAVLIDQIGCEVLAFTLGTLIAARGGGTGLTLDWKRELRALVSMPPFLALTAGILWKISGLPHLPAPVERAGELVGALTVPLVMTAFGFVLRLGSLATAWRAALGVVLLRLVVSPALALGAAAGLGLAPVPRAATTFEAGMPTMMFTLVLVLRAGLDAELAAAFITATMGAALVTLPLWAWAVTP